MLYPIELRAGRTPMCMQNRSTAIRLGAFVAEPEENGATVSDREPVTRSFGRILHAVLPSLARFGALPWSLPTMLGAMCRGTAGSLEALPSRPHARVSCGTTPDDRCRSFSRPLCDRVALPRRSSRNVVCSRSRAGLLPAPPSPALPALPASRVCCRRDCSYLRQGATVQAKFLISIRAVGVRGGNMGDTLIPESMADGMRRSRRDEGGGGTAWPFAARGTR